jgi:hypothetical protein
VENPDAAGGFSTNRSVAVQNVENPGRQLKFSTD